MLSGRFAKNCASVINQNVDSREIRVDDCSEVANCIAVRKIAAIRAKLPVQRRHFLLNRARLRLKRLANSDNVGTRLGERHSKRFADASAAARDQHGFAV